MCLCVMESWWRTQTHLRKTQVPFKVPFKVPFQVPFQAVHPLSDSQDLLGEFPLRMLLKIRREAVWQLFRNNPATAD